MQQANAATKKLRSDVNTLQRNMRKSPPRYQKAPARQSRRPRGGEAEDDDGDASPASSRWRVAPEVWAATSPEDREAYLRIKRAGFQ
jgi:hypothetical protein